MTYYIQKTMISLMFLLVCSMFSHLVFAGSNLSGQISRQISRTVSQSVNKNIADRMVANETNDDISIRVYTKEEITEVQQKLYFLGYRPGKVDGLMGNKTRNAIAEFQKSKNLKVDGFLSDDLLEKIFQSYRWD